MKLNKIVWLAAVVVILLSGSAAVWSSLGKPRPLAEPASPAAARIAATGRVEARSEAVVRAKGGGRIIKWVYAEGAWVYEGTPVVLLDQDLERSALREAEAELFQCESRFKRNKGLHDEKVISDQEFDDVDAAYRLALARRDKAAAALAERTILAPFAGRILKTYLEAGESIDARAVDTPLFVIGDTRGLKVRAEIDEQEIGRLAPGSAAEVRADAFPNDVFAGTVTKTSGILGRKKLRSDDPRERMDAKVLEVTIELKPSPRLKPGVTVEVKIAAGKTS